MKANPHLESIWKELAQRRGEGTARYFLPALWNSFGFKDYTIAPERPGEIQVDPYQFYLAAIEFITAQGQNRTPRGAQGRTGAGGRPAGTKIIYGAFLRTLTAWDHVPGGPVEPGTFLKAIALLPFLQTLGVEILYLLPIFARGEKYKKGELGSPYAVKDFYRLDPSLHDPLLGAPTPARVETGFKALVEACHLLGIRVIVDFVFRTAARDSELILEHPEWFYWIDLTTASTYLPPVVKGVKPLAAGNEDNLKNLYKAPSVQEYLTKFRPAPNITDPAKWEKLRKEQQRSGENILDLVEREFGVTTAPGFSDVICDPQPPWTDVTYLRFYLDLHPIARQFVTPEQPPYVLQDIACLNLFRGENPNQELWEYIINIIPYYQQKFGIDGARIDMGHALPPELNRAIIERTRAQARHFLFWSEEFDVKNTPAAKTWGYDLITGDLWQLFKTAGRKGFCRQLFARVRSAVLPLTGALELPDTPRAASYYPEPRFLPFLVLLNYFLPNIFPFINSGLELLEKQPMNLGLDNTEAGRFVLPPEDPMYGKLAFFDLYRLHWLQEERNLILPLLRSAALLRQRFAPLLRPDYLIRDGGRFPRRNVVYFVYRAADRGQLLLFAGNPDLRKRVDVVFDRLVPVKTQAEFPELTLILTGQKLTNQPWSWRQKHRLEPGGVVIALGEA